MRVFFLVILFIFSLYAKERIFVIERENSSVAVLENDKLIDRMQNMHNMNHGVMKFKDSDGYVISRDGYVIKFNPLTLKKEGEYKTSKSAIGFVIGKNFVAVANYDDKSVDILDRNLKPLQKIETNSRNVGIKIYKNYLIFAQMDNDKVTILKDMAPNAKVPHFKKFKEFSVGQMPFDAMILGNTYIVGFFLTKGFGVINLDTMEYKLIKVKQEGGKPVLKIPHFGFWSLSKEKVFIPAIGNNKVLVYDKNFSFMKAITTKGLPVFTSLSPKKRFLAVTFSGKDFPFVQIIDTKSLQIIKTYQFKGKVLHVRWSNEEPKLYVSVNGANEVAVIDTKNWEIIKDITGIKRPSGIFIYEYKDK